MGAPSKRARRVRTSDEFSPAKLKKAYATPKGSGFALTSWTLDQIFSARDAQLRGDFRLAAKAAESMRTDDAIHVAREGRLAPQRCIAVEIVPGRGARAKIVAEEATALFGQCGVGISPETMASIGSCLLDHDLAFGYNIATPREDGSRVDLEHHSWPIENVRWDEYERCFKTRVDTSEKVPDDVAALGGEVPIVHGDGRWVIYQRYEVTPFKHATLLAALLIWACHAYAKRDWSKSSVAHGNVKMIGQLPAGVPLQTATGADSEEAVALIEMMRDMVSADSPVGILPAGATAEFVANTSTAWQVFDELVKNAEGAAARIYLGTDGTLGSKGGAPGVDIQSLFGVAATKVEGDLKCLQRGIDTGVIQPWCAMNFGDSTLAPSRRYKLPDADADAARASDATRTEAFYSEVKRAKDNGFVITQEFVDITADKYGIAAPQLPPETTSKVPTIALAPTDLARVVSVNEARASAGLGALLLPDGSIDQDGLLTVEQFAVKKAAQSAPAAPLDPAAPSAAPGT